MVRPVAKLSRRQSDCFEASPTTECQGATANTEDTKEILKEAEED